MTIEGPKPLQVGQVLEGLLEGTSGADAGASRIAEAASAPAGVGRGSAATPRVTLWERMLAAVNLKFDGDNDGDVRGKG